MLHLCKVEHDPVLTLTDPLGRKDMSFNYFQKKFRELTLYVKTRITVRKQWDSRLNRRYEHFYM